MGSFETLLLAYRIEVSFCACVGYDDDFVFYVPLTLLKSYRDDGRMIPKDCAMKRRIVMTLAQLFKASLA